MIALAPPIGRPRAPDFDRGWVLDNGRRAPFLSYVDDARANWSTELADLHRGPGREHFLDVWTREEIIARVGPLGRSATVADLGCSDGYLLADLAAAYPDAILVGVDLVADSLRQAHVLVPTARLLQADVSSLPIADESMDVVVSANLLEHVDDDVGVLREIRRILRGGAQAVVVVPAGRGVYDYYDRFLGHVRRYARGEVGEKACRAGLDVTDDAYIASLLYPAFWLVKQRNRLRYDHLTGRELAARVARDIEATHDSRVGLALRRVEARIGPRMPFGIRNIVVLRRSDA